MLQDGVGVSVWLVAMEEKKLEVAKKFSGVELKAKKEIRLLKTGGPTKLGEVVSDSATQNLWLRNIKVRS